jgi:hypothetical protein
MSGSPHLFLFFGGGCLAEEASRSNAGKPFLPVPQALAYEELEEAVALEKRAAAMRATAAARLNASRRSAWPSGFAAAVPAAQETRVSRGVGDAAPRRPPDPEVVASLKPIGCTWSYLACRKGHLVPIR